LRHSLERTVATPGGKGNAKAFGRLPVPTLGSVTAVLVHRLFENRTVQFRRRKIDEIAGTAGLDDALPSRAQPTPQSGNVRSDQRARRPRGTVTPDQVHDPVNRHYPTPVEQEHDEDSRRLGATQRKPTALPDCLNRA
jgi:hypothetical protein